MPDEDRLQDDGLLGLIELLAMEAPPSDPGDPTGTFPSDPVGPAPAASAGGSAATAASAAAFRAGIPLPRPGELPEEPALRERARGLARDAQALSVRRRRREAGLDSLLETARELARRRETEPFLQAVARRARLLLGCDLGWVSLIDPGTGHGRTVVTDGTTRTAITSFRIPPTGGLGNTAAARSTPFWTPDYLTDERFPHFPAADDAVRAEGLRAVLVVPLRSHDTTLGALYVAARAVRQFVADEVALLSAFGDLATVAVERLRLLHRARRGGAPETVAHPVGPPDRDRLRARLMDHVLQGCGLDDVVAGAVGDVGGPLMVRDAVGRVLTRTDGFPEVDEAQVGQGTLDAHAERAPVRTAGGVWLCPAYAGNDMLGTLIHAPAGEREPQAALQALAQAVSVLLRMRAGATAAEGPGRDELLAELIADTPRSMDRLALRARRFGVDLEEPHVVLVLRAENGPQGRALVWSSSYAHRHAGLKTADGDLIVLVLPGTDASHAARAAATALGEAIGHPVTAGAAGPVTDPRAVHGCHAEARRCLDALTALGGTGAAASPRDLGFLGLLLADHPDTSAFIAGTIGEVLEYDVRHDTELAPTLEAYFAAGGSPRRAAEGLHVHPNTVSRRLERINDLLGPAWQEPVQALEVQLALRLRRTLHALRGEGGTLLGMQGA
ncbi:helix-turn-helix domain-containing protein [Streptomyces sp. NPDC091377]|uniref:helix-turn-helix domain-containing protein n=1 Tax=unclassified Streptomyces TaxID=2593676 RepID=UPI00382E4912